MAKRRLWTLALTSIADIGAIRTSGELVAFNIGPDGVAYFVVAQKPLDYRQVRASGTIFAKTIPAQPQAYRVVGLKDKEVVLDVTVAAEKFNIHDMQPLGNSELLLVCGRSRYRSPTDFEKNGRVYSRQGTFLREILLGDGIQSVQATPAGVIWTSYFDEGVFGNFGWQNPVGASGLIAWDASGEKLYQFKPIEGLDSICDCYALNVTSESTAWCYYYMDFPLVRICRHRIDAAWKCPVSGSHAFAVAEPFALFQGGSDQRDRYSLLDLSTAARAVTVAKTRFLGEDGEVVLAERVVGRGTALYMLQYSKLYRVDIPTIAHMLLD